MKVIYLATAVAIASALAAFPAQAFTWPGTTHSNGNNITQSQQSPSSTSIVVQKPNSGNTAKTYQSGSNNFALIIQGGSGDSATIKQ